MYREMGLHKCQVNLKCSFLFKVSFLSIWKLLFFISSCFFGEPDVISGLFFILIVTTVFILAKTIHVIYSRGYLCHFVNHHQYLIVSVNISGCKLNIPCRLTTFLLVAYANYVLTISKKLML